MPTLEEEYNKLAATPVRIDKGPYILSLQHTGEWIFLNTELVTAVSTTDLSDVLTLFAIMTDAHAAKLADSEDEDASNILEKYVEAHKDELLGALVEKMRKRD